MINLSRGMLRAAIPLALAATMAGLSPAAAQDVKARMGHVFATNSPMDQAA